ncbi:hypothetical protein BGZ50_003275 [Haplosporangium sp. Z 11]|nr:hypothetical protein BGZ50_003275 [Haplosporangium sp. Z 11]
MQFVRTLSPSLTLDTLSRQRSVSGQLSEQQHRQQPQQPHLLHPQSHLHPQTSQCTHEYNEPSKVYIEHGHVTHLKKELSSHTMPTRKLSGSNFMRIARQASDTAFRTVGLSRKTTENNLSATQKTDHSTSTVVYEQNPKVYLYQQQFQQQQPSCCTHYPRPHSDDTAAGDWAINNHILHSGLNDSQSELRSPRRLLSIGELKRNASMPNMKAAFAADAGEPAGLKSASQVSLLLPNSATNRSHSRQRVQPHHFIATSMSHDPILATHPTTTPNENDHETITTTTVIGADNSAIQRESQSSNNARPLSPSNKSMKNDNDLPWQQTPQRSPSRTIRSPHTIQTSQDHPIPLSSSNSDQQSPSEQQQFNARRYVLSDESLPGYMESESPTSDGSITDSKDLPPTPPGPPPPFQLSTRARRRTESGNSESHPTPELPATSDALKRKGSSGVIPQDVLKSMDPKDIQKVLSASVIASRVYRIMAPEQLEVLKKEQVDLQNFVEAMNVSLHIESRMRDASHSLIRLYENNANMEAVKAATVQLHATTRKMDQIVQKTQQAMWRLLAIQRLLLQHEGAVLNAGMRRLDGENRELSRTVMQLDSARDQEKEEKIKWKKEHNRLKVHSILFPCTPIAEESDAMDMLEPNDQPNKEQRQSTSESMEHYVKELHDDILVKDEEIAKLNRQLDSVKAWAGDFEIVIMARKHFGNKSQLPQQEPILDLQGRLIHLQTMVEGELKDADAHSQELATKLKHLKKENASLTKPDKIPARARTVSASAATPRHVPHQRTWRAKHNSNDNAGLHEVLRESLLELDRHILEEMEQGSSSSRPPSPPSSSSADDSESSATSSGRRSSSRASNERPSRSNSTGSTSSAGRHGSVLKRKIASEDTLQTSMLTSEEEDAVIKDATKEIRRLNEMVRELEQIVKQRRL